MGCDIHLMVERRESPRGPWLFVPAPGATSSIHTVAHLHGHEHTHVVMPNGRLGPRGEGDPRMSRPEWYDERCYTTFAMLANVRNYSRITPVLGARGVPDDACAEWTAEVDAQGSDFHSHSWRTVAELREYADQHLAEEHRGWDFWGRLLPQLEALGDPHHVRIVFAFDN